MIKVLLAPIQEWLLCHGMCGGCTMPLKKGTMKEHKLGLLVTCKCGRQYFQQKDGSYSRAKLSEVL